jgi:hypothetical protein
MLPERCGPGCYIQCTAKVAIVASQRLAQGGTCYIWA